MTIPLRGRSAYNPISASEEEADDNNNTQPQQESSGDASSQRSRRSQYNRALTEESTDDKDERISKEDTPLTTSSGVNQSLSLDNNSTPNPTSSNSNYPSNSLLDSEDDNEEDEEDDGERITVVILDSAQTKFPILANPQWTIGKFKSVGAKVHKVAPASQRLIFHGKLLEDTKTLKEYKIETSQVIVHLFPKPRVVMTSNSRTNSYLTDVTSSTQPNSETGAHVPEIFLDEEEQERRGQILVLGSHEIQEAQNNVKLLSLLLLVVCAMRLLALFSIAMGVAEEPIYEDDLAPPLTPNATDYSTSPDYQVRDWQTQDYFDLFVSGIGFYVATLGMKATTENTLRLANMYMVGVVIAGVAWNIWNICMYALFVQEESKPRDDDDLMPLTRDDFITVAFFTIMLPLMVWIMCCTRAFEFRRLIQEAEHEAAERIRSQLALAEGNDDGDNDDNGAEEQELTPVVPHSIHLTAASLRTEVV